MAQSYTRQSTFVDGDTITAALFNNEYNQLVNAFTYSSSSSTSTGHRHDGNTGQGGNIPQIGDLDFLNKIVVDSSNNRWGFFVEVSSSAVEQIRIQDGAIVPVTDNDIDLGTSSLEFKDAYFDGTVTTDALVADTADINGGTVDGAVIGGSSAAAGSFTTIAASGAITGSSTIEGTTITATTAFVPDASDGAALGTASLEFSDLYLADGAVVYFGDDQDVSLTHVADTGLLLSSTDQLQFGDSGTYIHQSADGVLDLVSDTEIEINATTIDINGAADISGNLDVGGNLTVTGNATIAGNLTFGDAASDTVAFSADVASNLLPSADNTYDLGASGSEWKDLYVDGTAYIDTLDLNGTAITATAAELNIMDGVTSTAAELNILDGVTSTTAELNILDGVTSTAAELNILDGVTATAAELNILDGVTSTAAELNILDGVTSTAAELNILDGVTATASEINTLDGITAVVGELNALDLGSTAVGTAIASKAVVLDSNKDYTGVRNFTITGELDAATLDISGDVDIDGTLEADAITIDGVTLAETIADTVGAMVSSNTETNITVSYEDSDNTLDFVIGTLNQDTTGTADNFTVSANNSTDETVYPVFVDGATGSQGAETDTGLTYNPSTGLLTATGFSGNLTGTLQTAAQTNITSLGTLTALTGGTGDFNWDSNTLVVDSSANRVGILNASPDVSLDIGSATDAVHVPVGTTAQRPGSPAAGYFRYNSTTSKFEGYTDSWGSIGGGSGTNMDTNIYTGDGSTTAFTLSNAPDDENNLMVFVDGVFQAHNAYSVSGTTLTLSAAPASGRVITAYHSTTTVGGSNNTINTMTGDGSDTTLTLSVAPVHENNVQVYFDGVYQSKSNYSISGTTLTFSTAPPTGVLVEAITNTNTSSTTANQLLDADSDTKIQVEESSDEDKIRFDIAGTEKIVLDSNGLGIGNDSPLAALDVTGTDAVGSLTSLGDTVTRAAAVIRGSNHANGYGIFAGYGNSSTDAQYIQATRPSGSVAFPLLINPYGGKVGIGTGSDSLTRELTVKLAGQADVSIVAATNQYAQLLFGDTDADNKGIVAYDNTNDKLELWTSGAAAVRVDASGHVNMPKQPAFLVQKSASQDNPASTDAITWDTERFDQNSDFGSNAFTAPVTGKYLLTMTIRTANADIDSNYIIFRLRTSNRDFDDIIDARAFDFDPTHWVFQRTVLADMDANDTASIIYYFQGGTAQLDIGTDSSFSGHLVA